MPGECLECLLSLLEGYLPEAQHKVATLDLGLHLDIQLEYWFPDYLETASNDFPGSVPIPGSLARVRCLRNKAKPRMLGWKKGLKTRLKRHLYKIDSRKLGGLQATSKQGCLQDWSLAYLVRDAWSSDFEPIS